jgi:peptidoglycan/LPS O-acetylase OafA/YrhL
MQSPAKKLHLYVRSPAMLRVVPLAWGLTISVFALLVRSGWAQHIFPWTTTWVASEPTHIVAHCILYGVLALLVRRFISKRVLVVLCVVLALGLVQELAQVLGARSFGTPELFDLMVDALAALAVLALAMQRERGMARTS